MAANRVENARTLAQVPPCPICHRVDQVQKMQTAYERGWVSMQAPPLPRKTKVAWIWIGIAFLVYGGANFYLFAQLGSAHGFGAWPLWGQILEITVIEAILLVGLILSVLAFARFINTRNETTWQYPTQEGEQERWQNIYHCRRDNVAFDAQQRIVLSPDELQRHVRILPPEPGQSTVEER